MNNPKAAATTAINPLAPSAVNATAPPVAVADADAALALLGVALAKPLVAAILILEVVLVLLATIKVVVPYACAASHCCVFSCWTL